MKENKEKSDSVARDLLFDKGIDIKKRSYKITGTIEDGDFDALDDALCLLESQSKSTITIKICSQGGTVYEALAMIGRIKMSKCKIITEGYGCIMSAASMLLAAGDERRMSRFAFFMHHETSYGTGGRHSEIKDHVEHMEREEKMWSQWMAEFSYKDADFWYNHGQRKNFYMNSDECLACGVIDKVF